MSSNNYSSVRPEWRVIRGFHQDASWFKVRWRSEMRRGPSRRKQSGDAPPAKLRCVVDFNAQSGKAIFRKTLIQPNWLVT
jgi:hypothetical protein